MSVVSFIPQIWEARLLSNFHSRSVADVISTKPTEVRGNTVKFNRIGAVQVKDYAGSVTFDDVNTTPIDLVLNQKKYFAIKLNDVDKVQAAGDVLDAYTADASASVQEVIDSYVLSLYTEAQHAIGNDTTPIALDKTNVYDYIVDLGTKLSQAKVPMANRFVIVNAQVLGLLSKDARFTANPTVLENGVVENQKINGMQVVVSENIANVSGKYKILAVHQSAVGYEKQIENIEAIRLESDFADAVRGLFVYGATVLRPEAMAVLTATIA
ncbi:phage capsid protein [Anoxybacillus sp. ST4]|uniref:phage major capsid protein n=1 Tax=Anoxybacillus sp. ST4 TaxID=2864181 RepID=UPI001C644BCF|nr:phage capsid protein [Anoxybacillus sp. ST4]MBW7649793.1 hypothetical protein [Anoxybacillus sp. ST4]